MQIFLLFFVFATVYCAEDGDPCRAKDDSLGVCREMKDCPTGLKQLKTLTKHRLRRCGFSGLEEVVCCPDLDTTREPEINTGDKDQKTQSRGKARKCVQACESYMQKSETRLSWHIINGENADEGDFPHMAAIGYATEEGLQWNCGGTLIAPQWVLTAAHCIITQNGTPTKIRMGEIDLTDENSENKQDFEIADSMAHPKYNIRARVNDIALIKLNKKARFTKYVMPACLYTRNDDPLGLTITGWGVINTSSGDQSWKNLQKAAITPQNLTGCATLYQSRINKVIGKNQICAADPNTAKTTDTCQGDSGGPLQVQDIKDSSLFSVVGVTSYGIGCGATHPSIYTRVSGYLDFIEEHVWPD